MLKLKTKTPFTVPTKRGTSSATVRLIIDSLFSDVNNYIVKGRYYFLDTEGVYHELDSFSKLILKSDIQNLQSGLPTLTSNSDLCANEYQRLNELVPVILDMEAAAEPGTNFGTVGSDYEIDND